MNGSWLGTTWAGSWWGALIQNVLRFFNHRLRQIFVTKKSDDQTVVLTTKEEWITRGK